MAFVHAQNGTGRRVGAYAFRGAVVRILPRTKVPFDRDVVSVTLLRRRLREREPPKFAGRVRGDVVRQHLVAKGARK